MKNGSDESTNSRRLSTHRKQVLEVEAVGLVQSARDDLLRNRARRPCHRWPVAPSATGQPVAALPRAGCRRPPPRRSRAPSDGSPDELDLVQLRPPGPDGTVDRRGQLREPP